MLFEDTYKTLTAPAEGLYSEKKSKFIALAIPVKTEEEVKEKLASIRKQYHDARHHCYAYILGPDKSAYRMNDDGEPSGTAGRPIYGQLLSFDVTNVLVVVVRYFGGIKLGVSGLLNAYKVAAKAALENSHIVEKTIEEIYKVNFDFSEMNAVMQILKDPEIKIIEQSFDIQNVIRFSIRQREADRFLSALQKLKNVKVGL